MPTNGDGFENNKNNSSENEIGQKAKSTSVFKRAFQGAGKKLIVAQMCYKAATVPEKIVLQIGIHSMFFIPLNNAVGFALLYDDYKTYKANKNRPKETPPPYCTQRFNGLLLAPLPCRHVLQLDAAPAKKSDIPTYIPKQNP